VRENQALPLLLLRSTRGVGNVFLILLLRKLVIYVFLPLNSCVVCVERSLALLKASELFL
jgi:hypothetical protein